ncbi:MAG: Serine/threonine-protein kinase PknD [Phycisphaerae bacterium]|nr:Serine/threonine-protein kinase PknD [Phycisphaerae bacterium]
MNSTPPTPKTTDAFDRGASGCPTPQRLEAHAADPSAAPEVAGHLAGCGACQALHREISANAEFLREFGPWWRQRDSTHGVILPTDDVPGYRVLEEIFRGGQGVVYKAIQAATKRTVAIKMLAAGGFATPMQRARFEREIEIVGTLRHPNIVTIYESGSLAGGRVGFTMEYVDGRPLDEWIAQQRAEGRDSAARRPAALRGGTLMTLFRATCDAVSYAHQRGVIHRDLKPSNILVDAHHQPHILDFGLAKALGDASQRELTRSGEFMGTIAYAAPEQVRGQHGDVDTRTDVYALGVIAYQMLTGRAPYPTDGPLSTVVRNIIELEPPRPSVLNPRVDGELDTIVLKALSKDPERRYQSAAALLVDVDHYQAGEPLDARRDSLAYVVRKFLRRHRVPAVIAAAFVVVVTVGFFTTLTFWRRAVRERNEARVARVDERRQRQIAEAVNQFLQELFAGADPDSRLGQQATLRDALALAAERLEEGALQSQPDVHAALRLTIGDVFRQLGRFEEAEVHLRRALELRTAQYGSAHRQLVPVLESLARLAADRGAPQAAAESMRRAIEICGAPTAAEDAELLERKGLLAIFLARAGDHAEAAGLFSDALAAARRGRRESETPLVRLASDYGDFLRERGRLLEAEAWLREALALCRGSNTCDEAALCGALTNLGGVLLQSGDAFAARQYFEEVLTIRRAHARADHPGIADAINNLVGTYDALGDSQESAALLRDALEIARSSLGRDHPRVCWFARNLAGQLEKLGRLGESEGLLREIVAANERTYGASDPKTAESLLACAGLLTRQRRLDEAAAMQRRAAVIFRAHQLAENLANAEIAIYQSELAAGRALAAECVLRLGVIDLRRLRGDNHPSVIAALNRLWMRLNDVGRQAEALEGVEYLYELCQPWREDHPAFVANAANNLALVRHRVGDLPSAEPAYRAAIALHERAGTLSGDAIQPRVNLAILLTSLAREEEAALMFERAIGEADRRLPRWEMVRINAICGYLRCLAQLGRHELAEQIGLNEFQRAREAADAPEWVPQLLARSLADVYAEWDRPEERVAWRAIAQACETLPTDGR